MQAGRGGEGGSGGGEKVRNVTLSAWVAGWLSAAWHMSRYTSRCTAWCAVLYAMHSCGARWPSSSAAEEEDEEDELLEAALRVLPDSAGAAGGGLLPSRWAFPGGTEKSRPLAANSLSE